MRIHTLSAHVAPGYKLVPASDERKDIKWERLSSATGDDHYTFTSPERFGIELLDKKGNYIATLHSEEVQCFG
jgi:hypothetical protein